MVIWANWIGKGEQYNKSVNSPAIRTAQNSHEVERARELAILYQAVTEAIDSIKVVHENVDELPQFWKAKKLLSDAKYIYFLGFGYHQLNLNRLNLDTWFNVTMCKGTAYNLDAQTKYQLKNIPIGKIGNKLELFNHTCYEFLFNEVILM